MTSNEDDDDHDDDDDDDNDTDEHHGDCAEVGDGDVEVNSVELTPLNTPWSGIYYSGVPLQIEAFPDKLVNIYFEFTIFKIFVTFIIYTILKIYYFFRFIKNTFREIKVFLFWYFYIN